MNFAYKPSLFSMSSSSPSYTPSAMSLTPPDSQHIQRINELSFSVVIHPTLQLTQSPLIHYNIAFPVRPEYLTYHPSLPPQFLMEPATKPPLPFIKVIHPYLGWVLNIKASGPYLTVADVLNGLYTALRTPVTAMEYKQLPSHTAQEKVTIAYQSRYRRITDPTECEKERAQGLKRIDFLLDRTKFAGLRPTEEGPEVWMLNVL